MKILGRGLLVGIFFVSLQVSANEPAEFNAEISSYSTSDDFNLKKMMFTFKSHRRDLTYPYKNAQEEAVDYGFSGVVNQGSLDEMNFRGWSVGSFWAKQYSPNWYLKLGLAFEGYQYDGLNQSEMNPLFQAIYHLPEKLTLTLDGQQKLLYSDGYLPGPVQRGEKAAEFRPSFSYSLDSNWRVHWRQNLLWDEGGNRKWSHDASVLYAVSVWPTWFLLGVGGEYLTNSKKRDYWSPSAFRSYGLRSELNSPIVGNWFALAGVNLNRIQEESLGWGNGYYMNLGLQWGDRNDQNVKLQWIEIKSSQSSSQWLAKTWQVNWVYFF